MLILLLIVAVGVLVVRFGGAWLACLPALLPLLMGAAVAWFVIADVLPRVR